MTTVYFSISDGSRFPGDFTIAPVKGLAFHPFPGRIAHFVDTVGFILDRIADNSDFARGAAGLSIQHDALALSHAQTLRALAEGVAGNPADPSRETELALIAFGHYDGLREMLFNRTFVVQELVDPKTKRAIELLIHINPGRNATSQPITTQQRDLYLRLWESYTVINTVCDNMIRRDLNPISALFGSGLEAERGKDLKDKYIRKLAGVGRVGLQGPDTELATATLTAIETEFVAQEAGRIKNGYLRRLGVASAAALAVLAFVYVVVERLQLADLRENLFLLLGGAAAGTWLSFSLRRVTLAFRDLAVIEEDLLEPTARIFFVLGLASIVGLLLWAGVTDIDIGSVSASRITEAAQRDLAILVGLFCGIAERALATAISGRATGFVQGVGPNPVASR